MATHRERIVKSAARRFRKKGLDGVSVADLMKDAGLTHGGFYNHFASKEELIAFAARSALDQTAARWSRLPFEDIVRTYLSARHQREPEIGCAVAALGAEAARLGPEVKASMSEGIQNLLAVIEEGAGRKRAVVSLSSMVGAMVLARCSDSSAASDEFLNTVSEFLISRKGKKTT